MDPRNKQFRKLAQEIGPIATGRGGCIASDRITVDGHPVGYMYRSSPSDPVDSGWCFFAGDEDDRYRDNADNFGFFDVNTIANYDHGIVPHLDSPIGSAFIRDPATGRRALRALCAARATASPRSPRRPRRPRSP